MGITIISRADISQKLQDHGQPLAYIERLAAEKKETLNLYSSSFNLDLEGKAIYVGWAESDSQFNRTRSKVTKEIEQEAVTFVVTKGQKGGRQQ